MLSLNKLLALVLAGASTSLAQYPTLLSPTPGTAVQPNQSVVMQVGFPDQLTGVSQVAIVLTYLNCRGGPCPTADDTMGTILYQGNFTPAFHEGDLPPYQNFTVIIPPTVSNGTNMLAAVNFFMLGASGIPVLALTNVTVQT